MSKHTGRSQRWPRQDARTYSSDFGKVVYQQEGWYILFEYKIRVLPEKEAAMPSWQTPGAVQATSKCDGCPGA